MSRTTFAMYWNSTKIAISLQYLKKELEVKLIFCMQINIRVCYKLILTLWVLKFPATGYYHNWWAWSSILKVSLQYVKKEVRDGVHFLHAHKHQSFYKLALSFLTEVVTYKHIKPRESDRVYLFRCLNKVSNKLLS